MRPCPQCASPCDSAHKFCPACGFPVGIVAPSPDDPLIGRTLPGGYIILELVGIGGMGRVYRAEQTNLGRTVAVKIIHPHLVGEENAAARFITEARAASLLNHPNSVSIIDFGKTEDGQLYLVMEFLRGRDLARVVYDEGQLPIRRIVATVRQVLAALAEAHHLGIIHRDLKPENIILEPVRSGGDFVKVVDFGLAKMRAEAQMPSITSPGIVCGTPEYMSPEQGRGDALDARSDLYAVGVILFQLLTGRLPFEAETPTQAVLAHLTQTPPDPRTVAPDRQIPAPLAELVLRALSKEKEQRFESADALSDKLSDALQSLEDRSSQRGVTAVALRCPSCGTMNPTSQRFCGTCGTPLTTGAASARALGQTPSEQPFDSSHPVASQPVRSNERAMFPLPLVGREDDIAWLEQRRKDAKTSTVGARIIGEVGVGRSRVVREFLDMCAAHGDLIVEAGPDPAWAEVGYYALRKAIVGLAKIPSRAGTERHWAGASAEAKRGLAEIFHLASDAQNGNPLSADERRFAAAEALRWALSRASEQSHSRRGILAIDDLQNVDGASRNAFADVLSEPPIAGALIIATYTPGFDPGWAATTAPARVIAGLPIDVATLLVGSAVSLAPISAVGQKAISPLYLEQLLRFGREQGGVAPTRLGDLLALRIERLPTDARRVLQAVAVWGDDANDSVLLPLLPDDTDLVEALGYLRRSGMIDIVETHSGEGDSGPVAMSYRTTHPLLRDIVLTTIPAAVRKQLHAIAAEVCEKQSRAVEMCAMHECSAANAFQALILLERVSIQCASRGDIDGSIMALRRGLDLARRELFRGELDDPMRAVLIFSRKLGEALSNAGHFTDADGILREALDMTGPSGQDRARVLGALARVAHGRQRRQEAKMYLREALELATRSGLHELVASLESLERSIAS